jgi:hypothetical protein
MGTLEINTIDVKKVVVSIKMITTFINFELQMFPSKRNRGVVMEILLSSSMFKPHFLHYYLPPIEAKVQYALVQSLKVKLEEVKGVQSKEKLAYKGTLLNATISKDVVGVRASARVLNTIPTNITFVVQRQKEVEITSSSQWALLLHR